MKAFIPGSDTNMLRPNFSEKDNRPSTSIKRPDSSNKYGNIKPVKK